MKYTWITLSLCWGLLPAVLIGAQTSTFNAGWQFVKQESETLDLPPDDPAWTPVNFPHSWNQIDAFDDQRGYDQTVGWYRRTVRLPRTEQNRILLKLEGAYQLTQVYVNGQLAGEHKGGYTAFAVDLTPWVELDAENTITLRVDSRYNRNIPPLSGDFTFYGGVYRDVYLIRQAEQHFDRLDGSTKGIYLSSPEVSRRSATLRVKANTRNTSAADAQLTVRTRLLQPDGQQIGQTDTPLELSAQGRAAATMDLEVAQPELWSPEHPNLYRVEVRLLNEKGEAIDKYTGKYGFRWFEMDDDRAFLLNGKPIDLIGVNRHQDYRGLANALPDALHRRDVEILKEMGGNFLRIAHYPQDPAVLEACDELGILVWEEIPIVNSITVSEAFKETSTRNLEEMIRQHQNHPSVIMWGLMNEVLLRLNKGLSDHPDLERDAYLEALEELTRHLHDTAKKEDPARWTVIANHLNYDLYEEAGLNEIADIVAWNIYFGWYSADMPRAGEFLDRFHQNHPDKGIIVSEYGGGSDPRIHASKPRRFDFTVEWQTRIHASYYRQIVERPHVMAGAIWAFADFGSEGRKDPVPRINSKGILHADRRPKDSYLYYQAALADQPYLQIGSQDWRVRYGFADANGSLNQPIWIFSNQPSVEVTANGEHLGSFEIDNYHAVLEIPFQAGTNRISVSAGSGLSKDTEFHAQTIPPDLRSLSSQDIDLRMNVGAHFHYFDRLRKEAWIPERAYQPGSFGYVEGRMLITWNGFRVGSAKEILGSENEPIYQTHRDELTAFRADLPDGWYEVTLHFAEIYSAEVREKLANNLDAEGDETAMDAERRFHIRANGKRMRENVQLEDFQATAIRFQIKVSDEKGLLLELEPEEGTTFLSGIAIRGL